MEKIGATLFAINCLTCNKSFTKQDIDWFYSRSIFSFNFASRESLPSEFGTSAKTTKAVRRIALWAFLDVVSQDKIMTSFPALRKSSLHHHYYLGDWRDAHKDKKYTPIPSSSEILIFDKIKSVSDFTETLADALAELEKGNQTTVFIPKIKKPSW